MKIFFFCSSLDFGRKIGHIQPCWHGFKCRLPLLPFKFLGTPLHVLIASTMKLSSQPACTGLTFKGFWQSLSSSFCTRKRQIALSCLVLFIFGIVQLTVKFLASQTLQSSNCTQGRIHKILVGARVPERGGTVGQLLTRGSKGRSTAFHWDSNE